MNYVIIIVVAVSYVILIGVVGFTKITLTQMEGMTTIAVPIVMGFGFYIAWKQLDAIKRARTAETILSLYTRWDSERMENSRKALMGLNDSVAIKNKIKQTHRSGSDELYPLIRVANFFDTVGSVVYRGYLDKYVAYDLMGDAFDKFSQLYSGILLDPEYKNFFRCFQDLDDIFKKVKGERAKKNAVPP